MDIFISWSGAKSHAVATALHKWLPQVANGFEPWLSSADIEKGARWGANVAIRLQQSSAGIICLTADNLNAPWILFEAGAISKQVENTFVCPLLIGLEPSDVQGPLAQFQSTRAKESELLRLVKTLNKGLGEKSRTDFQLEEAFEVWWPRLAVQLKKLPDVNTDLGPRRSERDLLEEILEIVRRQGRPLSEPLVPSSKDIVDLVRRYIPSAEDIKVHVGSGGYRISIRPANGDSYAFLVAPGSNFNEIEGSVALNVARHERHQARRSQLMQQRENSELGLSESPPSASQSDDPGL